METQTNKTPVNSIEDPTAENSLETLSVVPATEPDYEVPAKLAHRQNSPFRFNRAAILLTAGFVAVLCVVSVVAVLFSGQPPAEDQQLRSGAGNFANSTISTKQLADNQQLKVGQADFLDVNGRLQVGNTLVLKPSAAPQAPRVGQIYYDQTLQAPLYYNGSRFVSLGPTTQASVLSLGGASGDIVVGGGLQMQGGQLNARVLSVQGQTGAVAFVGGSGITINGTTIGVDPALLATIAGGAGSTTLQMAYNASNDGVITLDTTRNGLLVRDAPTPVSGALFAVQSNDGASSYLAVTSSGTTVTNQLSATSGVTLGVQSSVNGLLNLANATSSRMVVLQGLNPSGSGNATVQIPTILGGSTDTVCLLALGNCAGGGGGGVTSLNGLTDALTLNNASGSGGAITINNASTAAKGIAQFDATNFTASSGTINTIQDIATTSSPTFNGLTANGTLNANGAALFKKSLDSSTAFQVQNASARNLIQGDTIGMSVAFGNATDGSFVTFGNPNDGIYILSNGGSAHEIGINSAGSETLSFLADHFDFSPVADNTSAFSIQNASLSGTLFRADTVNMRVGIGGAPANSVLTVGTNTSTATGGITFGTDTNLYRAAASTLKTDDSFIVQPTVDTGTAFRVQNAAGTSVFNVDTTTGALTAGALGVVSYINGTLNVSNGITTSYVRAGNVYEVSRTTSSDVNSADVLIYDSVGTVTQTTTPRDSRVVGVARSSVLAGQSVAVAIEGEANVKVDTAAVNVGDQLVTSSTANRATVDNNATTGIIGIALAAKAGGSNGTVTAMIRPVGGQYSPVFRNASNSATALQVQNAAGTAAVTVSTNNVAGGANAAAATLVVGMDSGTNRSINAAGSINASGADYAEYIPWQGAKPEVGSIVSYRGSSFVVSSIATAAFIGNDKYDPEEAILVTFAGQVPVRVTGPVQEGYLLVSNGDGTARAVSPSQASLGEVLSKIGIAQGASSDVGVKKILASIGTTSDTVASALQNQTMNQLNVSGQATLGELTVRGSARIEGNLSVATIMVGTIEVSGHIVTKGDVPSVEARANLTITVDGNDTAGTITVTTGPSEVNASSLGKLNFKQPFGKAPRIVLSPQDEASSRSAIFPSNKSKEGFALKTGQDLPANTTMTFDYIIVE